MNSIKKLLSSVLIIAILCIWVFPALTQVRAAEYILDPASLKGMDYTNSDVLAATLNKVFAGDIDIYSNSGCTNEVAMRVGYVMSKSTMYHVKSKTTGNSISGWQCYIYANAVYNRLFQEWVGHADGFSHSETVVKGGDSSLSYEKLRNAGVRCGAYVRTTDKSSGAYNGSNGHSLIILAYDQKELTYLEGNADGHGLIRVTVQEWSDFNYKLLTKKERYIAHIVQPKKDFYEKLYPACTHQKYEGCGVCSGCGHVYDWKTSFDSYTAGYYRLTEDVTPRREQPYSAADKADITLSAGQKLQSLGSYRNAFDQVWYAFKDSSGRVFYVNSASLKLVEYLPLQVTCNGFTPENGAVLDQESFPVRGTLTSNYPLKTVTGYLDGVQYAQWTAENENTVQLDIRKTDLNRKLSFSSMSRGNHTVTITAQSYVHGQSVTVAESTFFINVPEPCTHNYAPIVTKDATCTEEGILTYTCTICEDSFTRVIAPYGHDYQENGCTQCGDVLPMASLSGKITAYGDPQVPVTVTLTDAQGQTYTATTLESSYSIKNIPTGTYQLEFRKEGCVTGTGELTLGQEKRVLDLLLCCPGDVNMDGQINIGDAGRLYSHIRETNMLKDPYALACADSTGDGQVNIGDVARLYRTIRNAV